MIEHYFDSSRKRTVAASLLAALFVVLYVAILGERPLFIPDEPRYGEIAREMLASGDWIVPRLNGLLYFEKPPFGHWLNAISLAIFGENPFAVRFSSALATAASAGIVFVAGRKLFKSRAIPFLATFIFLTTLEVQAIGTFSVLDPVFAAVLNGGILSMALAVYSEGRKRLWLSLFAGLLLGFAFLTKGFLAFALPALVLTPWLIIRNEYAFLLRFAWITVVVAVLTVTPWALAIHSAQPDFWRYFFWVEHIQRFAADNAQHKAPFYYFLMFLPALGFPWIFFLPATVKTLRNQQVRPRSDGAMLLLALWGIVPFVFFSMASGKLSTYILPCFMPFSVITAVGLSSAQRSLRSMRTSAGLALVAVVLFAVALIVFIAGNDEGTFTAGKQAKQFALFGSLILAMAMLCYAMLTRSHLGRIMSIGLSMVPFLQALPLSMPESVLGRKAPEAFIEHVYSQMPADTVVVTNGSLVRAASWSTRRMDIFVIENGGETTYGLEADDGAGRFLTTSDLQRLIAEEQYVLVLCKGPCSAETMAVLPATSTSMSYGNFFAHLVQSQPHLPEDVASVMGRP